MPVELIIFDLDGTLADTLEDIASSLNYALGTHGFKPLSREEIKKMIGGGVSRLVRQAIGESGPEMEPPVRDSFLETYMAHLTDTSVLYPGVKETLDKLSGYKKAVISNKRFRATDPILKELGISHYFDLVVGGDSVPEKKPSPVPVKYVLEKLGVRPSEAVLVGDSAYDIEAGRRAGLKCVVGAGWGYGDPETLKNADYVINNMELLIPILYGREPMLERRTEQRFILRGAEKGLIRLLVQSGNEFVLAGLMDLSLSGLSFETAEPVSPGDVILCRVSAPKSISREVEITAQVRHVQGQDGINAVGCRILETSNELWFRVITRVHEFMEKRKGEMF